MRKSLYMLVVGLVVGSFAIGGAALAAQKTMKGFKMEPQQKPIPVEKVKKNWAELTKDKKGWNLYTVKGVDLVSGNLMKVMLQDQTGLDHELTLTQSQWLAMSETLVETTKGVMVGAQEEGSEITAFAAPIKIKR